MTYGIPGIGGSLGRCGVCGESFVSEILLAKNVSCVKLGGVQFAVHAPCLDVLIGLCRDGKISAAEYEQLPEGSPIRDGMKRLCDELEPDSGR